MKTVSVVAAVIFKISHEGVRSVFATQRGYGEYKGWWEFPGGKIEPGESPESALKREICEELATEIHVGEHIGTIEYNYPAFHLSMQCFECRIISGNLELLEHENAAWLTAGNLRSVKWLPADITILEKVQALLTNNKQNG